MTQLALQSGKKDPKGYIEPAGAVAIAAEGRQTLALLRRRKDETFKQLLARLDTSSPVQPSMMSTSTK